jgi:hypothetical protein
MLFFAAAAVGAEFGQPAVERRNHLYRDYMYSRLCLYPLLYTSYRLYAVHSVTGCILAQRETSYILLSQHGYNIHPSGFAL